MADTVEYFMWGYQPHYCISVDIAAKSLFGTLDRSLNPRVFLIGFLTEPKEGSYSVCVEPEDCGFDPDDFGEVPNLAKSLRQIGTPSMWLHPSKEVAARFAEREWRSRLAQSLKLALDQRLSYDNTICFCSYPQLVQGYLVSVVLQLRRSSYEAHYSLARDHARGDDRFCYSTSLINAVIQRFLAECSDVLRQDNPGMDMRSDFLSVAETLRRAGNSLMYAPALASKATSAYGTLFLTCNTVSSLKYEGEEGIGQIVIARVDHPDINVQIRISEPIPMSEYRAVRKLLETTDDHAALLSDGGTIYGLGSVSDTYNPALEDIFTIAFMGHYKWRLVHAGATMMNVAYEQPSLPRPLLSRAEFEELLYRLFPTVETLDADNLWKAVFAVISQRRGTTLVVSDSAAHEASRLTRQSIRVAPSSIAWRREYT